jgi:hypothetical protein
MKRFLLAGAAVVAVSMAATVASAQDVSTGHLGVTYSSLNSDVSDLTLIDAQGTVSFNLSDTFELQLDGQVGQINFKGPGSDSASTWGATAHLFYDNGSFKGGVFYGYEDIGDWNGLSAPWSGYGLEGRWAASDTVSIGAVAARGAVKISGAPDFDLSAIRGEISIFSNDNLRFDVALAQTSADWGPFSGDATIWSAGGEWQMMDQPVSFTFGYSRASSDYSGGDASTWSLGVHRTFGGTLKDRDRNSSPFLGMPLNFGGVGGILAAETGAIENFFSCYDDDGDCPSETVIDNWFGQWADEETFCDFLGVCGEEMPT